jgi:uncharacterized protein YbjT (DUF2867 family)
VDGVDAIVFTLRSDGAGKVGAESVDYGGVRNVLGALGSRRARIALMTSIEALDVTDTAAIRAVVERAFAQCGPPSRVYRSCPIGRVKQAAIGEWEHEA